MSVITNNNGATFRTTVFLYVVPNGDSIWRIYNIKLSDNRAVFGNTISCIVNTNNHSPTWIR